MIALKMLMKDEVEKKRMSGDEKDEDGKKDEGARDEKGEEGMRRVRRGGGGVRKE